MQNLSYKLMSFCGGLVFYAPVSLLLRTSKGITIEQFFILQMILSLVTLLGEIPTGVIVDKIGYKRALVLSGCLLTVARAMFLFANSMSWFILEAMEEGVAFCLQSGTDSAYLYSVSGRENYAKERAESTNWGTAGFMLSTLGYALIYHYAGLVGLIVATVITTFGGTMFAVLLPQCESGKWGQEKNGKPEKKDRQGEMQPKEEKKQDKEVTSNRPHKFHFFLENLSLMLITGALSLGWLEINYFYVDKLVGAEISVEWMSLIIMGYSLVQMLLPWVIKGLSKWKQYFVFESLVIAAVLLLLLFTDNPYIFIPVMLLLPLVLDLAGVTVSKYTNTRIDSRHLEENRATVLSVMNMGSDVLEIVFLLLSVVICEGVGKVTFLIAGVILLVLGVVSRRYVS